MNNKNKYAPKPRTFDEKVQLFIDLQTAALELNKVSDELSSHIATIDEAFKKLNCGVEDWVPVFTGFGSGVCVLGYGREKAKWGLLLADEEEVWLFNNAPRYLRVKAIDEIPTLVDCLTITVSQLTHRVTEATAKAASMLEEFKKVQ